METHATGGTQSGLDGCEDADEGLQDELPEVFLGFIAGDHRKHLYQLLANELHRGHVFVSFTYMTLQLVISMVMIYVIPDTPQAHWIYLIAVTALLCGGYVWFMKASYHLHEEYLASLRK